MPEPSNLPGSDFTEEHDPLDALLGRFEEAWQQGEPPDIDAYLPPGDARALAELVHIDLERRLKAGQAVRVEDYLQRYPALAGQAGAVVDLIRTEYELKRRQAELRRADYYRRFPPYQAQLQDRLADGPPPATASPAPPGPGLCDASTTPPESEAVTDTVPAATAGLRYRSVRFHARGGLGEVWVAHDEEFHREVALKRIREDYADDPDSRRRFLQEAAITGRLEHPGIVPAYGLVQDGDGRPCYAMRLLRGGTLQDAIRRFHEAEGPGRDAGERSLALRQLLGRFIVVCNAVAYAHSRGIVHRDLKPANVMLGQYGETLIVDWGLAKSLGRDEPAGPGGGEPSATGTDGGADGTRPGEVLGTPAYMSPEQAEGRGDGVGPASDVYSLGAILHTILTGQSPFQGSSAEVLARVKRGEFRSPRQGNRDVARPLDAISRKAMALRAEARYATPLDLAADVEHWLADEPVSADREPWTARLARWRRRHRPLTAAVLAAVVLAGGGAVWWQWQSATRAEVVRQQVGSALDRVNDLQNRERWGEARAVLAEAQRRLDPSGPADLLRLLQQARDDLRLVRRLDAARLKAATLVAGRFDRASARRDYAAAFRAARLGRPGDDVAAVAARIRRSPVRKQLAAALDDWAVLTEERPQRVWLLAVAQRVDPDPWRDRFRKLAVRRDRAELARLTREGTGKKNLSPQVLAALGRGLMQSGIDAAALLTAAQRRYPHDFWLNFELGNALSKANKFGQAIGYFRAALALRPETAALYTNLGIALKGNGRWEEATAAYRQAIDLHPRDALAHFNLGLAWFARGRREKAIACFRKALTLDPRFSQAHTNLGAALLEEGRRKEAIASLRRALALDPRNAAAHTNLGKAWREQGRLDQAIACYRKAIALDPRLTQAHHNLGVALHDKGQLDRASACFQKALTINPKYADAQNGLGLVLQKKGQLEKAIVCFRQALALDPKLALAHYNLGNALQAQGQLDQAIACYPKALTLKPRLALAYSGLGNALQKKGQLEEAIACYRKAIAINPEYADAHNNLGNVLSQQGRFEEAVTAYRKALTLDPKDGRIHYNLGNALAKQGQRTSALACYQKAVTLDPQLALAHYELGNLFSDQGRWDRAITAYQKALVLDPNFADAHSNLGHALKARGRLQEAVTQWLKALALDPRLARAHCELGGVLFGSGRLEEAGAAFRKAVALDPGLAVAHYHLGVTLQVKGQLEAARAAYRRAIALTPDYAEAHCNLAFVLTRLGRCTEALAAYRQGHRLGSQRPRWLYPSAQWVKQARRLAQLEQQLPALLQGQVRPGSAAEGLEYAQLCSYKRYYRACARLSADAFAADPPLAGNLATRHRDRAARAAALSSSGQGKDAAALGAGERARWRRQALAWLRADLALWAGILKAPAPQAGRVVRQQMQRWQNDPDLAGIRDEAGLAWLPEEERVACRQFWAEVAALLARTRGDN
jgi:tetratricopeptide (TPR) repeat protein